MDNLVYCLNATMPIFLLMALGIFFKKIGLFDEEFVKKMNSFVFKIALPVMLFNDLAYSDFYSIWDAKMLLYCFLVTVLSISISIFLSHFLHNKDIQGEFVQASYRSSVSIIGIAFITNLYHTAGKAPVMLLASVPLYNVMAVVVLSFLKPNRGVIDSKLIKDTIKGIIRNPIIIGILAGFICSMLKLPRFQIVNTTLSDIGALAAPLGLMGMGAKFNLTEVEGTLKPAIICSLIKLVGFVALFMPIAVYMGFEKSSLASILIMLGSATTVSAYVMAKSMGHDGTLTLSVVMITTLFSSFTLTGWLYILRAMGLV